MSVIVQAGILHQSRDWPKAAKASYKMKKHVDPIHVTVHFLQAAARGQRFEAHIRTLRTGKGFDNVMAKLVQLDKVSCRSYSRNRKMTLVDGLNE